MKTLLIFLILIFSSATHAIYYEIAGDFGYDKQIFGATRENSVVSRSYSGGLSIYMFELTAIDLNASKSTDTTSVNDKYVITGTGYEAQARQDRIETNVYGVGIKQMLVPKDSFLVPIISIGYAKQLVYSDYDSTYKKTADSSILIYTSPKYKQTYNSVYGTFMLQLKVTQTVSLKASVKTLFPAFDFNKAKDNLKYSFGFSWIF